MLLYDLGIYLYRQGISLAANLGHNVKARRLNAGLDEIWSHLESRIDPEAKYIWIHAASLGEFEQGRPLIEKLRRRRPDLKIVLTFFSPSGYEVRKNYAEADVVAYLPMDTPANVRRFLNIVKPEKAIFVKYEFWLNYLKELKKRSIPTYLISGIFRRNQLFFKPYGGFYRKALNAFTRIYLQDEGSRNLLKSIGLENTVVAGDTRFDRVTDIMRGVKPHPVLDKFCGSPAGRESGHLPLIFMVGSSWPQDEEIYGNWLKNQSTKEVKGVIAPHEFDARRLQSLIDFYGGEAVLLSEAQKNLDAIEGKKVLILDCFGLLASAYSYCDIAYIGGGFGAGLHNINEAAVYGVPVVYGPNNAKFIEAAEMKTRGGGIEVTDRYSFERNMDTLIAEPTRRSELGARSEAYIKSKLGATEMIFNDLFAI